MSRSPAFSAGLALFRPIPETPFDQAFYGSRMSAVPARSVALTDSGTQMASMMRVSGLPNVGG